MGKKGESLAMFLSGAVLGSILGILYAPDKGSSTRGKVSFRLRKYKELLEEFLDDLLNGRETPLTREAKAKGAKVVSATREKAERLLEDVDDLLVQIRGTKKEV